jgi:hypothetical protein
LLDTKVRVRSLGTIVQQETHDMTDTTQGQDLPDDNALFQDATSTDATTLDKFENPELPLDLPDVPKPKVDEPPVDRPAEKAEPPKDEAHIPAWRLREESEARRQAERRYEELQAQLRQQAPSPQQGLDIFENPSEFVQQQFKPYLEQIRADLQMQREGMSLDWALRSHGNEKVAAARQALEAGLSHGDNAAKNTYQQAMQSHDPYGVIVRWHNEREVMASTGGNLDAYRQRILDEALKDPEYQRKVIESAKGQAQASGRMVERPVKSTVASSPSLGDIGAGGSDGQVAEPSDEALFRAAVNAKRR